MSQRARRPDLDDNIDEIMASIIRGDSGSTSSSHTAKQTPKRFGFKRRPSHPTPAPVHQTKKTPPPQPPTPPQPTATVHKAKNQITAKPKKPKKARRPLPIKKIAITMSILAILGLIIGGGYLLREPIIKALRPKPPFGQELIDKSSIPLYYPTRLPGSFKIETESIQEPEPGIVLYKISDDDSNTLNITLQEQPTQINVDPIYAVANDVREINTKFGVQKIGVTPEEKITITNTLTGKTWVIISYSPNAISDADLTTIINSLVEP